MIKQAILLVGGKGTRLGALTLDTPKPMLDIGDGVRFLDVLIKNFARQGFNDIILLAGYLGQKVFDAYDGREFYGASVSVIIEPEPRGTGGALALVKDRLDEWFILSNGDSIFDINYRDFVAPTPTDAMGRIALRKVDDVSRYGSLEFNGEKITAFREKTQDITSEGYINAGIYLLNKKIADMVEGECSIEREIFPKLVEEKKLNCKPYDGYFLDIGLFETYEQAKSEVPKFLDRPAMFLDRDGVINVDTGYTHKPESLKFLDGIVDGIKAANDKGYYVIVVTNQAGVARGLYTLKDVDVFHNEIQQKLSENGAFIDAFYSCPFHKEGIIKEYKIDNHPDRKPNPGMILSAMNEWPIVNDKSFLIGDKEHDVEAAIRAGIKGILYEGGNLQNIIIKEI